LFTTNYADTRTLLVSRTRTNSNDEAFRRQLNLESGTICRRISDSRTDSDSRRRHCYSSV